VASYRVVEDMAQVQFYLAAIHGASAMAATWLQSCGLTLGFEIAVQGAKGQFPPGGASEAGD
jgi:hypothetical protein